MTNETIGRLNDLGFAVVTQGTKPVKVVLRMEFLEDEFSETLAYWIAMMSKDNLKLVSHSTTTQGYVGGLPDRVAVSMVFEEIL